MKHGKKILKIGRNASHRKATLQSMSASLIEHKRITTTFGKAKALRQFVEPILTKAKDDSTHGRRQAFRRLQNKEAVKRLYDEVATAIGDRPGGYTRIVKLGQRGGDAAEMAIVELVDFNDVRPEGASSSRKKTRRSRSRSRGGATAAAAPASTPTPETPAEPEVTEAETPAPEAEETVATPEATAEAEESQAAEAVASDAADPDATGNPQPPEVPDAGLHPDTEQGASTGTGEPPPEASPENRGRSQDNR